MTLITHAGAAGRVNSTSNTDSDRTLISGPHIFDWQGESIRANVYETGDGRWRYIEYEVFNLAGTSRQYEFHSSHLFAKNHPALDDPEGYWQSKYPNGSGSGSGTEPPD